MTTESLDDFAYLWSSGEWALVRLVDVSLVVQFHFQSSGPTLREIQASRSFLAGFTDRPISELKSYLAGKESVVIGSFPPDEATRIKDRAESLNLNVSTEEVASVRYLPTRTDRSAACIIEDNELAKEVVQEMLRHAVPVLEPAQQVVATDRGEERRSG